MRILHVTPYYEGAWAYGGIPRVATALARGLARRGHEITVCSTDVRDAASRLDGPGSSWGRQWTPVRTPDGVLLRVFPNLSNALAYRLQCFVPLGLTRFLRKCSGDFDVAHIHGCHNLPGASAARHLRRAGVPYLLAPNGTAPRVERRRLAKYCFDVTAGRGLLPNAARVLAVTEAERLQLLALGVDAGRARVVPNPIDLSEFDDPPQPGRFRSRTGLGGESLVLFLGKLTPRKRVDVLVEAFAQMARPNTRLIVAGNDMGSGRAVRQQARDLGVADRTVFTGLLTGQERLDALADADVVAYPGEHEIFGLVPIEALLCGTPVIVADDSGCGEVIRRMGGGHVIPPGDAGALAAAIQAVLDAPGEWRAAAAAARTPIRHAFGVDRICAEIESVYAEIVGDASRGRAPSAR